jgi:uncharacterized protein
MVNAYFLDTSALVKRYMTEIGAGWIEAISNPELNNEILLARVTWVETLSAFARLHRESKINSSLLAQTINVFKSDWESQYQIVEVERSDYERAGELIQYHPLRAYDSIQLTCALKIYSAFAKSGLRSFTFVSADKRLIIAAQAEGITVENPKGVHTK